MSRPSRKPLCVALAALAILVFECGYLYCHRDALKGFDVRLMARAH